MIIVKEGSSLQYSLLWIDELARQRFLNRLGLIRALTTTLEEVQEPTVAEQKIHWWHEEIQRMLAGEARHPECKQCQSELKAVAAAQAACLAILSAASTLRFTPPVTIADADQLIIQDFKARLALLTHALSESEDDLVCDSHNSDMALALGKHEQLVRLPSLLHRGLPVFSDETYKAFNVQAADLAQHIRTSAYPSPESTPDASLTQTPTNRPTQATIQTPNQMPACNTPSIKSSLSQIPIVVQNPGRQALLQAAIANTHDQLLKAVSEVSVTTRYRKAPNLPLWRLLVLREKQLALWRRKQPDLLRERSTLTPIVKLYTAWRNKR